MSVISALIRLFCPVPDFWHRTNECELTYADGSTSHYSGIRRGTIDRSMSESDPAYRVVSVKEIGAIESNLPEGYKP